MKKCILILIIINQFIFSEYKIIKSGKYNRYKFNDYINIITNNQVLQKDDIIIVYKDSDLVVKNSANNDFYLIKGKYIGTVSSYAVYSSLVPKDISDIIKNQIYKDFNKIEFSTMFIEGNFKKGKFLEPYSRWPNRPNNFSLIDNMRIDYQNIINMYEYGNITNAAAETINYLNKYQDEKTSEVLSFYRIYTAFYTGNTSEALRYSIFHLKNYSYGYNSVIYMGVYSALIESDDQLKFFKKIKKNNNTEDILKRLIKTFNYLYY